jgi:bacterioferritin (cytochrome b1)
MGGQLEEEMIDMMNQAEDAMTPIFLIAGSPGVGKSTEQSVEETVAEILERTGNRSV